jgi:hypothetical protein
VLVLHGETLRPVRVMAFGGLLEEPEGIAFANGCVYVAGCGAPLHAPRARALTPLSPLPRPGLAHHRFLEPSCKVCEVAKLPSSMRFCARSAAQSRWSLMRRVPQSQRGGCCPDVRHKLRAAHRHP